MRLPVTFFHLNDNETARVGEPVDLEKPLYGTAEEYEKLTPYIEEKYRRLLKNSKKDLGKALDNFLEKTSQKAIVGQDFLDALSKDLAVDEETLLKTLLSTHYLKKRLQYIKRFFKRKKKEDPLEYAESFGQLVALLGPQTTHKLLRENGVETTPTTIKRLYKVSMMPSSVKRWIKEGKLLLTIASELPKDNPEKAAQKVLNLDCKRAREILKLYRETLKQTPRKQSTN